LNKIKIFKLKKKLLFENNKKSNTNIKKQLDNNNISNNKKEDNSLIYDKKEINYQREFKDEYQRRKNILNKYSYTNYFENISYTKNNIFLEN
jgi:hypothetical protein